MIEVLNYDDINGDGIIGLYSKSFYSYNTIVQVKMLGEIYYYESNTPDSQSYYTLYEYNNSNPTNVTRSKYYQQIASEEGNLNTTSTFTFDDSENPFNKVGLSNFLSTNDFTPGFSPNNLIHASFTGQNGNGSISADNVYDEDGDLTKSTYTIARPGSEDYIYSVAFTYKEI